MLKSYRFVWFIAIPLALGVIGISDNMVSWFFGAGYDKVEILLKILPVLAIIIGMSNVTGIQYLIPTKRQNVLTRTVATGAVVNFCLNLFLIPRLYSVGAAFASVTAEIVITVLQLSYVREEIDLGKVWRSGRNYLLAGMIMLCVLRLESSYLSSSLLYTVCMIGSGTIVYSLMLLLLNDTFFLDNVRSVAGKLRNLKRQQN